MADSLALELKGITKTFGSTVANKDVDLQVRNGEILSILGENGSGKTTLMNMVSGIYFPDSGKIFVNGREVVIRSPKDAFDLKIGMIHQHFKLVDVFDAVQNIVLGVNDGEKYNLKKAEERVKAITDKYGFVIDLNKKVYEMSVSEKQTVEIIKVLYRGADILILDEPTAVLTPQETEKLFDVLRKMREDNKSIIIITHKLHEVLEISDRVTILRKGEYVDTVETKDATEQSLTEMMMGEKVSLNITRNAPKNPEPRIVVEKLSVKDHEGKLALDNVSFTANSGEILGIAGISGCGQKELLEAIAGLQQSVKGSS
ncbi:MAG: ABC transporter ATP-binding protein, partial [Eubacterium sp.]